MFNEICALSIRMGLYSYLEEWSKHGEVVDALTEEIHRFRQFFFFFSFLDVLFYIVQVFFSLMVVYHYSQLTT